ncbi:cysteine desulfurase [Thioalkalivibrio sp. XN279]|uniref:cysteine desulfurase n=1 Tax=Thioalkalivibrio sp. XN279 TaxID=2714953 RepID=UPI00140E8177|nr:cysteine desulfurase [Thioalkalivibrio sp. XN279]NHA14730.1 cysteine desulfurase [Thioalkalivibrio sp. XN279]
MSAVSKETAVPAARFDVEAVRRDFPVLHQEIHDKPLAYLDNAASSQHPVQVIEAVAEYYRRDHANVHRGVHQLSQRATDAFEGAREKVRRFINAASEREVIFTRGTTEAINLVAQSWGRANLGAGDEIVISHLEHHANIVPWQLLCQQTGAELKVIPMTESGEIDVAAAREIIGPATRLLAFTHVSNALGTISPVAELTALARAAGALVLLDGAQGVPHMRVDVQALGCDFYAFSGHKMFAPTGIGVLWGREELLRAMPPWQGGGDMILAVTFEKTTYNELPWKFEAGTPHIAGAIGLGAAIDYLERLDFEAAAAWEHELLKYGTARLGEVAGLRIIGTSPNKAAVISFTLEGVHPHDIGTIVDHAGVAIRTGHHCAMPVMDFYGVPATARASFAFYNTRDEVDRLAAALQQAREVFA